MSARDADAGYRQRLEEKAASLGIRDRILVLDEIGDDQMLALYRQASVVVSIPSSDGLPVSLLEAMACGTPIVASDLPGVRELLGPVMPHLLVPAGDPGSLAAAVQVVLELGTAERAELSEALRGRVVAEADHEANMLRMESLYRELAARR
jgi:glycosyltransferase involved in cell wall biosynthesis